MGSTRNAIDPTSGGEDSQPGNIRRNETWCLEHELAELKMDEGSRRQRGTEVLKPFASSGRIDLPCSYRPHHEGVRGRSSLLREGDMLDENGVFAWEAVIRCRFFFLSFPYPITPPSLRLDIGRFSSTSLVICPK